MQAIKIGLPSGIQQTFVGVGAMALMSIVSTFGVGVLAAYSAASRVDMFVSMPAMNLAAALSTFVGQNLGAGKLDRIKRGLRSTIIYSTILCLILSLIVYLFGDSMMALFTDSGSPYQEEIISVGHRYLIILSLFYVVFSTMFIYSGVARGAGATIVPMLITLFSLWIVRIPISIFLSDRYGPDGIWWSIPIGWTIGCIGSIIYYHSNHWRRYAVVKPIPLDDENDINSTRDYSSRV